ncbi:hypothetical protein FRC02_004566 [Tulasnella sp. 418]|nr:hypothetical protein FRC02_004566 [Tulasnella sp. 418]
MPDREDIAKEMDVSDIRESVETVLNDPLLRAVTVLHNERELLSVTSDSLDKDIVSWRNKTAENHLKMQKEIDTLSENSPHDVKALMERLKSISLPSDAGYYVKRPLPEHHNSLVQIKPHSLPASSNRPPALVYLSMYAVVGHIPLNLTSKHVFLSTHTLGDLVDIFPCASNDIALEILDEDGKIIGFDTDTKMDAGACVVGEDGMVWGDGMDDIDYSDRFIEAMKLDPNASQKPVKKGPNLYEALFDTIPLRLNYPYYLVHQGNCQHYFIIDEIRLYHPPTDPPVQDFPITIHTSPVNRHRCRICAQMSATLSIVGDIRIGESPALLCGQCWEALGKPDPEEEQHVIVVPLTAGEMA